MSGDLLVRQVDSELQHFLPKLLHVIAGGALKMHVAARGASLLKQNTANATALAYNLTFMILFFKSIITGNHNFYCSKPAWRHINVCGNLRRKLVNKPVQDHCSTTLLILQIKSYATYRQNALYAQCTALVQNSAQTHVTAPKLPRKNTCIQKCL